MFDKELLIKAMEENNFTAYKLWKSSKVAQSTISTILNGINTNPSSKTLEKLAYALDVPLSSFFTDESNEYNNSSDNNDIENQLNSDNSINTLISKFHDHSQSEACRDYCIEMVNKINESFFKSSEFDDATKKDILDYMTELFWRNKIKSSK